MSPVVNKSRKLKYKNKGYVSNSIKNVPSDSVVVEGSFYQSKPVTVQEMITRRINQTLCCCLLFTILIAFISYYVAMNYEAKLNKLDSEIVRVNSENSDLQAELDRYKSFNNVDDRVGKFNLLQKADKVIEVTAMSSDNAVISTTKNSTTDYRWALGY